jgi:hypothetical protein
MGEVLEANTARQDTTPAPTGDQDSVGSLLVRTCSTLKQLQKLIMTRGTNKRSTGPSSTKKQQRTADASLSRRSPHAISAWVGCGPLVGGVSGQRCQV